MEVEVVESGYVVPGEETPRKALWLSNIDVAMANRRHTPLVYFFRSNGTAGFFDVGKLRAALARALVAFYPLAGRLGVAADGRLEISCTAEGVLFVVARSGLTVDGLVSGFEPSSEMRKLFIPCADPEEIMLAVQVTFLKCGGVVLGMALHHIAVDGASTSHFLQMWSSLTRDGVDRATFQLPCHDRTLLRARSPPDAVHANVLSVFSPQRTLSDSPANPVVTRTLAISRDQLAALKRLCGGTATTTFRAVAAHVWQCACVARRLAPNARALLIFPANVRRHLKPPLPEHYFGNAIILLRVAGLVQDIVSGTLASVADRIKSATDQLNDELVRSAIDNLEVAGKQGPPGWGCFPETELRMVCWLGMPLCDADFGWGKPRFMARAEKRAGGFVYVMPGRPEDNTGVRVVVSLGAAIIEEFQRLLYAKLHHAKL